MDLITRTKIRIEELKWYKEGRPERNHYGYVDKLVDLNERLLIILES